MSVGQLLRRTIVSYKYRSISGLLNQSENSAETKSKIFQKYQEMMNGPRREIFECVERLCHVSYQLDRAIQLAKFSAIGIHMVRDIPERMKRMGKICHNIGENKLGDELLDHAIEEEGHYEWYENDLTNICAYTEKKFGRKVTPEQIRSSVDLECARKYAELHKSAQDAKFPIAWFAIQHEIERLSLSVGPKFIGHCVVDLGFDVLKCLSFASSHVSADKSHAPENVNLMVDLLEKYPQHLMEFVKIGTNALKVYQMYFEETVRVVGVES